MIKKVRIKNFLSFKDEEIVVHPEVNLLIGINGSGKSNFLKVLKLLKEGVGGIGLKKYIFDQLGGFDNCFFKGETDDNVICIEYVIDASSLKNRALIKSNEIIYKIEIHKSLSYSNYYLKEKINLLNGATYLDFDNGKGIIIGFREIDGDFIESPLIYDDKNPQELVLKELNDSITFDLLASLNNAINKINIYEYFDTTPKSIIRKPILPTSDSKLNEDGSNLPQILNTIKINQKSNYKKIVELLKEVNPMFQGFDFNFIGGNIELMLEETELNKSIHVSQISDGTLRYLCLLAIIFNSERGNIICIDEPEVGLHPDMILNLCNAIKEISSETMTIISTHSDDILNYFELENIKVFEKDNDNSTKVKSFTGNEFEDWYENYSLGNMWKHGDLGGVRYGS